MILDSKKKKKQIYKYTYMGFIKRYNTHFKCEKIISCFELVPYEREMSK